MKKSVSLLAVIFFCAIKVFPLPIEHDLSLNYNYMPQWSGNSGEIEYAFFPVSHSISETGNNSPDTSKWFDLGVYVRGGYSLLSDVNQVPNQILNVGIGLQTDFWNFFKAQIGGDFLSLNKPISMMISNNNTLVSPRDFNGIYPTCYLGFELDVKNFLFSVGPAVTLLDLSFNTFASVRFNMTYRLFQGADKYLSDAMARNEYGKAETMMAFGATLDYSTLGDYVKTPAEQYYFYKHPDIRRKFYVDSHASLNTAIKNAVLNGAVVAGMTEADLAASLDHPISYFRANPSMWRNFFVESHPELDQDDKDMVMKGNVLVGMTPNQALCTLGYPIGATGQSMSGGVTGVSIFNHGMEIVPDDLYLWSLYIHVKNERIIYWYKSGAALVFLLHEDGGYALSEVTTYHHEGTNFVLDH